MWEVTFVLNSITVSTAIDTGSAEDEAAAVEQSVSNIRDEYGLDVGRAQEILVNGEEFDE